MRAGKLCLHRSVVRRREREPLPDVPRGFDFRLDRQGSVFTSGDNFDDLERQELEVRRLKRLHVQQRRFLFV